MPDFSGTQPSVWWLCIALFGVVGWFINDARDKLNSQIGAKASKEALEALRQEGKLAADEWRADIRMDRERSRQDMQRLELQYEQKFNLAVSDLRNQISTLDAHVKSQLELIVKMLESRQ